MIWSGGMAYIPSAPIFASPLSTRRGAGGEVNQVAKPIRVIRVFNSCNQTIRITIVICRFNERNRI